MAIKNPGNLRAWAQASPEELKGMAADDRLYKSEGINREDEEAAGIKDEDLPLNPDATAKKGSSEPAPEFNPEDIETYAYEVADQLSEGGGNDEIVALVEDYDPEDGQPDWVGDAEIWEGAVDLASEVVDTADPVYWQLAAHLYDYMQGPILEPEAMLPMIEQVTQPTQGGF